MFVITAVYALLHILKGFTWKSWLFFQLWPQFPLFGAFLTIHTFLTDETSIIPFLCRQTSNKVSSQRKSRRRTLVSADSGWFCLSIESINQINQFNPGHHAHFSIFSWSTALSHVRRRCLIRPPSICEFINEINQSNQSIKSIQANFYPKRQLSPPSNMAGTQDIAKNQKREEEVKEEGEKGGQASHSSTATTATQSHGKWFFWFQWHLISAEKQNLDSSHGSSGGYVRPTSWRFMPRCGERQPTVGHEQQGLFIDWLNSL